MPELGFLFLVHTTVREGWSQVASHHSQRCRVTTRLYLQFTQQAMLGTEHLGLKYLWPHQLLMMETENVKCR